MLALSAPVARIMLRYVVGPWVVMSGLSIDVNDPDLFAVTNFVIGGLFVVVTEGWYALAHKKGWAK